ncbi:MAG: NAD(+) diphosphatase [Clostridiaceae bacterium]|nr:NAD(+) diphosphatase [Clostridiaceae bacterium]
MIQDITPHIFHNEYNEKEPQTDSLTIITQNGSVLICENEDGFSFPQYGQITQSGGNSIFLFTIDEVDYFWLDGAGLLPPDGFHFVPRSSFRSLRPKHLAFAGLTAMHIINWYQTNRFCGCCGQKLEHDHNERMLRCPACSNLVYPRINPAVIVAVTNGTKLLMTKYAGREYSNYALVAGFTEIGESIEETVQREVMEETGIRVKNITYYKSQPWAMTSTILMGFFCELDGDDTLHVDEQELSLAVWMERDEITAKYDDFSLTNEMICRFKGGI